MVKSEDSAREGLELLDVGVGIFDADLRLVFANPAFRRLRRYPESLCQPGVSLESLLAFNAERGDFGPADPKDPGAQVRERLEEVRQALAKADERALEREMADGQILNIRYRGT
ncbi:MAG TPA: PAS-domain containing protein, partial [Kiloniellaceae bacterium]|nr:PAS-domain containing protein [Kiloniellaceae bacterium]